MSLKGFWFDAATHTYGDADGPLAAVTTVLKPLYRFEDWPEFRRAAAMERGRIVHDAIHADNTRDLDEDRFRRVCVEEAPYLDAWRSFRDQRRYVPILNEYRVASPRYRVAGTLDCLGTMDGHGALVDFKTGRPADVAADLQTAAYLALATEWATAGDDVLAEFFARYPVVRRYAIQLRPDASFRVEAYTKATDFRDFMILAAAHNVIAARRPAAAEAA